MSKPLTKRDWLLRVVTIAPFGVSGTIGAAALLQQSGEARVVAVVMAIGTALFGGFALIVRSYHWRTVESRILRARPTERCRRCGYSSDGLDTERSESGTFPFDHARCPECGHANPR